MMEPIVIPRGVGYGHVHTVADGEVDPQLTPEEYEKRNLDVRNVDNPLVSVIFVARNESEWIGKATESLYASKNEASFECLVYDDGSTDKSCEHFPVTRLLTSRGDPIGPSRARNWGAMSAKGKILIFCDGHLKFNDGWIDQMISHILDGRCDVVNPVISDIAFPMTTGYGWSFDTTSYEYKWASPCSEFEYRGGMAGGCFAISRDVFLKVGMFDKAFTKWGMEDSELSLRLSLSGYRIGIDPSVDVGHFFKESNSYGVDWFSYNYNFLRMAFVNMDQEGFDYVFNERIQGTVEEKENLKRVVVASSKFRKMQADRIRKISFRDYLAKFGQKMT